jgi:2-methylcitrate dehydratase PrpD
MELPASEIKESTGITYAKHAVKTKYENIPVEVVEVTRKHILDYVANTIGGGTRPGCVEIIELLKRWGGRKEATVLGYGYKIPAHHAAQANATMGNALDYDDCDDRSGMHAGNIVISTAFAVAELRGKVSGKNFITAVAVGNDIGYRLGRCQRPVTEVALDGWWGTQVYGYLSASITAGKILRLNDEQMLNAIGIAYQEAAGSIQFYYDVGLTKSLGCGFAARAGVLASLLAKMGVTGVRNALEGPAGMFNLYFHGNIDPAILTMDLGKRFMGTEVSFKPYPCCRMNHTFVDATLALKKEHNLKPDDVDSIIVSVGKQSLRNCEPLEVKHPPKTAVDAQFSIPWVVAVALVYGKVLIKDFTSNAIKDPAVLRITERISIKPDDSLSRIHEMEPAVVEVKTNDGKVFSKRVDYAYGNPQKPMSWDTIADKLEDCACWAAKPISEENLTKIVKMCKKLEEVDDVGSIIQLTS